MIWKTFNILGKFKWIIRAASTTNQGNCSISAQGLCLFILQIKKLLFQNMQK